MRRASSYAMQARKRFCQGRRIAPIDLVLSGQHSVEEWVELLNEERERHAQRNRTPTSSEPAGVSEAARVPLV